MEKYREYIERWATNPEKLMRMIELSNRLQAIMSNYNRWQEGSEGQIQAAARACGIIDEIEVMLGEQDADS